MKTLGEKILELRKKNGLSQEEFGGCVGEARQTVSKWEADTMQPSLENVKTICKAFDIESSYFFDDSAVKEETAVTEAKNGNQNIILITLSVFVGLVDFVLGFFAVYFAHLVFSPNRGDYSASMHEVQPALFYVFLVAFLACSALEIFLIVKICKNRRK